MANFSNKNRYTFSSRLTKDGLVTFKVYEDGKSPYTHFMLDENYEVVCVLGHREKKLN